MEDPPHNSGVRTSSNTKMKGYEKNLVASASTTAFPRSACKRVASLSHGGNGSAVVGHAAIFLLKVAALETVRRVSRTRCPHVWRGIQALQIICYPPFKWIQRWAPFQGLVKGMQMLSRPLLVLSIATAFSDQSDYSKETSGGMNDSHTHSETNSESRSLHSSLDARSNDGNPQNLASENWLMQLKKELESQGITLPERIDEDELRRFYSAANGDFPCFLLSVKKAIRWRETYSILSKQELEMWSNMVFWHGYDVEHRPCLIVRLGLACINLPSHERPRFAQAVISQVEHGVLHLVDRDNPQITVIVDCDGISPLKIPMQIVRSCSAYLQDNYPNRLGYLLVIRLPPVVRVIAQTFIQVLKPVTRKKLRIDGKTYHRVLFEYLQTLPSYLGGNCACKVCSKIGVHVVQQPQVVNEINKIESYDLVRDGEDIPSPSMDRLAEIEMNNDWDHLLRTAVIGLVMVFVFIALVAGIYDPESHTFSLNR